MYALFAKELNCLPGVTLPPTEVVYIGILKNVGSRIRDHFEKNRSDKSTVRCSLGAILKVQLKLSAIPRSKSNYDKFRFTDEGENQLSEWMNSKLEYSMIPCIEDKSELETKLICRYRPALNLKGNKNSLSLYIKELSKHCREEAKCSDYQSQRC